MIIQKEQPTSGHFIMLWVFKGRMYAQSHRWEGNTLEQFDEMEDDWTPTDTAKANSFFDPKCKHFRYAIYTKACRLEDLLNAKH